MKTKDTKQKIKEFFLENPTKKLRVRQIERELKLSLPSVIRYAKELVKEGILKIEEISGINFFVANYGDEGYLLEKQLHNTKRVHNSGIINYLVEEYSNPVIIIFGSFSKGEDIEASDVDIYIQTPSKKKISLAKYEKILGKKIQLFQGISLKNLSNPHLANNIVNGIILNGSLEIFDE